MSETDLCRRYVLFKYIFHRKIHDHLLRRLSSNFRFRVPELKMEQKLPRDISSQVHEDAHTRWIGPTEFRGAYGVIWVQPLRTKPHPIRNSLR